jgi:hypothetical protein
MAITDISKVGNHVRINDSIILESPSTIEIGQAPRGAKVIVIRFPDTAFVDDPIIKIPFADLTINGSAPASPQDAITSLASVFPSLGGGLSGSIPDNLAVVAISGSYNDLSNKPTIPTVPTLATVATSGAYNDLSGKPTIPTVPTLATVATSGAYNDLTGKPTIPTVPTLATVATSGAYNDLTGKPTIPTVPTLAAVATSGAYNDLSGKPTIPDLTGVVTTTGVQAIEDKTIDADLNDLQNLTKDNFAIDALEAFDPTADISSDIVIKQLSLRDLSFFDAFDRADTVSNSGDDILGTSTSGGVYDILSYNPSSETTSLIQSNKWISKVTDSTVDAAYTAIQNIGGTVTNIGAKVRWTDGGGVIPDGVAIFIVGQYGGDNIQSECVLIRVTRSSIAVDVYTGGVISGASRTAIFNYAISRNQDVFIDIKFNRETLYYAVGNNAGSLVDPLFNAQRGAFATWQHYFNAIGGTGVTGLSYSSLWVGSPEQVGVDKSLMSSRAVQSSVTATLTKTVLYTKTIKANSLGRNGYLRMECLLGMTNNANLKTFTADIGGVEFMHLDASTANGFQCASKIACRNSQIVSVSPHPSNNYNATTPATVVVYDAAHSNEINWSIDNDLVISCQLFDVGDTGSVESVQIFTYQ